MLAVAEFIAEMRAGTVVRDPMDPLRIAGALRQRRGRQFHPAVADAAARLVEAGMLARLESVTPDA